MSQTNLANITCHWLPLRHGEISVVLAEGHVSRVICPHILADSECGSSEKPDDRKNCYVWGSGNANQPACEEGEADS